MKKRIFGIIAFIAITMITGLNYQENSSMSKLPNLVPDNIEALAEGESIYDCPNGCLTDPGECFCHYFFPYKEAYWKND